MKEKILPYIRIFAGTFIFSLAVSLFADPGGIVAGGITGIAIILKELIGIPLYISNIIFNIPLFLISIKQRGMKFIKKSLFAVISLSVLLSVTKYLPAPYGVENDILMAALMSGTLTGIGLGLILRETATSGGTDMLAAIIKFKKPQFPISALILVLDAVIILAGISVFGFRKGVYAILSLTVATIILDRISEGIHFAKAAFIFSDKYEELSEKIFKKLGRGNTAIYAKGMYTQTDKKILYVVIDIKETVPLQNIVRETDPTAFMTITDIRKVLGEGFVTFDKLDDIF